REALEAGRFGALNLHFSLLPRWRGAAPVQHALLAGDEVTDVTVMQMDEGLDTGPILNQLEERIRPEDDAGSLGARLARNGGMVLVGVLRMLPTGRVPARPQDDRLATWAPRLLAEDRVLDWMLPADAIVRRVRLRSRRSAGSSTSARTRTCSCRPCSGDPGSTTVTGRSRPSSRTGRCDAASPSTT